MKKLLIKEGTYFIIKKFNIPKRIMSLLKFSNKFIYIYKIGYNINKLA